MISLTVIIHIHCHVSCHLSAFEVAFQDKSLADSIHPLRSPPLGIVQFIQCIHCRLCLFVHIERKFSGIDTAGTDKVIRACGSVAHRHTRTSCFITLAFQLKMKPHHKLPGLCIIYYFRPLKDTAACNVAAVIVFYGKCYTFIFPIGKILG